MLDHDPGKRGQLGAEAGSDRDYGGRQAVVEADKDVEERLGVCLPLPGERLVYHRHCRGRHVLLRCAGRGGMDVEAFGIRVHFHERFQLWPGIDQFAQICPHFVLIEQLGRVIRRPRLRVRSDKTVVFFPSGHPL